MDTYDVKRVTFAENETGQFLSAFLADGMTPGEMRFLRYRMSSQMYSAVGPLAVGCREGSRLLQQIQKTAS